MSQGRIRHGFRIETASILKGLDPESEKKAQKLAGALHLALNKANDWAQRKGLPDRPTEWHVGYEPTGPIVNQPYGWRLVIAPDWRHTSIIQCRACRDLFHESLRNSPCPTCSNPELENGTVTPDWIDYRE